MAAFPCSHSFPHSSSHTTLTSPAVFQGPAHASRGGNDLCPGLALWPFPMLLSLPLRLAHFVRGHVYSKVYSQPLSLSGPILSASCRLCMPLLHTTNTHTYTLLSSPDLAWCPGDLVLPGSCSCRASLLALPLQPSTDFLNLQGVGVELGWALHSPLYRLSCCPLFWSTCYCPRRPRTLL